MARLYLDCEIKGTAENGKEASLFLDCVELEKNGKIYSLSCNWNSDHCYENEVFSVRFKGVDIYDVERHERELQEDDLELLEGSKISELKFYCENFEPEATIEKSDGCTVVHEWFAKNVNLELCVYGNKTTELHEDMVAVYYEE